MGEVWKARDMRLDRIVALKLLPALAGNTDRVLREARAASAINHPHICTIYETGEHEGAPFIAMEYLDGETLTDRIANGPLDAVTFIDLAMQIADALDAAHGCGVVHRDLKPANLFLTTRGSAKVLDFGIARMATRDDARTMAADPQPTAGSGTEGTVAYMAPEQARGEAVDARSDLFALGAVLYELATGHPAFAAATTALTYDAILNRQPVPMSTHRQVPDGVAPVVSRLLAKDPTARYQSARELLADLRALERGDRRPGLMTDGGEPPAPSIAVLPFTNLSADPESEYMADGITEEVIGALGHIEALRVAGRTSSFAFKDKAPDLAEVAARLHVATVLTGSVRKAGSRLRITAELVNIADGFQLWSERFDRQADDMFAIQDEIATAIAAKLRVSFTKAPAAPALKRRSADPGAYEQYLEGRVLLNRRGKQMPRALECFQRALAIDPDYALAHAGAADAYTLLTFYGALPVWEAAPKVRAAARRAIALDPSLADPHAALAFVHYGLDWDQESGDAEIATALRLNPRLVNALTWQSLFLGAARGRFDEAAAIAVSAAEGDPLAAYPLMMLANNLWIGQRPIEAEAMFLRALAIVPDTWQALRNVGLIQALDGRHADGIETLERALVISGRHPWVLTSLADAQMVAGHAEEARRLHEELLALSRTRYVQSIFIGASYSIVGDLDGAFAAFEKAEREREAMPLLNYMWFVAREARRDPRFAAMMARARVIPAPDLVST
jgi:TolB-like protein